MLLGVLLSLMDTDQERALRELRDCGHPDVDSVALSRRLIEPDPSRCATRFIGNSSIE